MKGKTFWGKIFLQTSLTKPKQNRKKGPFSLARYCRVPGKTEKKPFWFSSLDEMDQFDTIIFRRTFVELFWLLRVDRKTTIVTIIVAFHFMKRRLKITNFRKNTRKV